MLKNIVVAVLEEVIKRASSELKVEIKNMLDELEEKAKRTPNQFDDFLVKLLKWLFEVD